MQGPTPRQWPFADVPRQRSGTEAAPAATEKKKAAKPAPAKRVARAQTKKPAAAKKSRR